MPGASELLAQLGVSAEEVERARADGTLELLVLEHLLQPSAPVYDLAMLAERAGIGEPEMQRLWLAMGFPAPPEHRPVAGDVDVEVIDWARDRIKDPAHFERTVQQLRVFSSSLARMAETSADDLLGRLSEFRASGMSTEEALAALIASTDLAAIDLVIFHLYRLQLLAATRRRLTSTDPGNLQQELAVGFVDLVEFTALSQELEPEELASMVSEFEARSQDTITQAGGRVVKTIGDEVMFSTPSPAVAVEIGLRLAGDERRGPLTPDVRAGVACGPVLTRWGDEFGPVVNLASRLVNIALPGSVIVSDEVHEALSDEPGLNWRPLRPRRLKGIGRVPTWVVRRSSS